MFREQLWICDSVVNVMLPHTSIIEFPGLKKSRRYGAKVKSGCITCKIRRVKCDETRPNCSRCMTTGRRCDGYIQDKVSQYRPSSTNHKAIIHCNSPPSLNSSEEAQYLEFYLCLARHSLANAYDHDFWTRIVLQMGHSEPAIHHALIALGYLSQSEPGSLKHARSGVMDNCRQQTLFHHYNKAIRCLVDQMGTLSYSPEIGLVTCLVFICIEFLRGNYHTAFTHLDSGLKLIREYHGEQQANISQKSSQDSQLTFATSETSSGSTNMITTFLTPLFIRAIASAQLYGASCGEILQIPCTRPHSLLKHPFRTVLDAQSSSHILRNSSILFARTMARKIILRESITAKDFQQQTHLLECHSGWFGALRTFEQQESLSKEDSVTVSSLKVGYYSTYIMLACAVEVSQGAYDAHILGFKALIRHAKIVIDAMNLPTQAQPSSTKKQASSVIPPKSDTVPISLQTPERKAVANFTFEVSLIPCLHFAATRCRCPTTRREAISLLKLNPPREALWDAEQHLIVSTRVIEIEETEIDPQTGWAAESSRLWCAVIDGNMDRTGGFWVSFAYADWVLESSCRETGRQGRLDSQWDEWFIL